ncbi:DUF1707 domain-containing protein [Corynebacterium glyciniphilum]|uniref:DUF1707 SHOCT-like domain-containing protein n=1 Tax=Corynebacterium glyciniphilum TaxID=1404244 RepID=UPI002355A7FB
MNSADGADKLRLSDNDRIHAMSALGTHFADGRLDEHEFNERSGAVAEARTVGELRPLFTDLPGGLPFDEKGTAVAVPGQDAAALDGPGAELSPRDPEADEVESLRKRGNLVQTIDGVVLGVTLVTFLVLQFVFHMSYAWIVWPSLAVTLSVPRILLKYSDEDEELFEEIKEAEQETRKERLRRAAERMHELEPRDKHDEA